jgi:hypothetical protein
MNCVIPPASARPGCAMGNGYSIPSRNSHCTIPTRYRACRTTRMRSGDYRPTGQVRCGSAGRFLSAAISIIAVEVCLTRTELYRRTRK